MLVNELAKLVYSWVEMWIQEFSYVGFAAGIQSIVPYHLLAALAIVVNSSVYAVAVWPFLAVIARLFPRLPRLGSVMHDVLRAALALLTGIAILRFLRYLNVFHSYASADWIVDHSTQLAEFTGKPLAGLNMSAFMISMGPNDYRSELISLLHKYGMPTNKVHVAPALNLSLIHI